MTFEELKEEAYKQGYYLTKKRPNISLEKCLCGKGGKPAQWIGKDYYFYRCNFCGLESEECKTEYAAKLRWNEKIKKKRPEEGVNVDV